MDLGSNGEEPTSLDGLYSINLMPSELFLKFRKEIQGFRVGVKLEVGIGYYFQMHATGWKWKLTTCYVRDDISRIRNKTSLGSFQKLQGKALGTTVQHELRFHASLDRLEAILTHAERDQDFDTSKMNYEDLSNVYVSQDDFQLFHSIDRELYTLMVFTLLRDPAESLQIMALWLWLEQKGFKNVVKQMLSFPHFLINELAEEALSFLNFISAGNKASFSYENGDMSVIQSLMEKEMAFQFFHENRINAAQEIAKIGKEVCIRALGDIMERAILERKAALPNELAQKSHQMAIGAPVTVANHLWTADDSSVEVHPDDRTMFVTFSKGYPVFEWELEKFFTVTYGSCLESIHMQEVGDNEQSLFARIVFISPSTIETILDGLVKAKFTINGKHVWMRKFVPKRNRAVLLQQNQG